jgi:hypothetical protein
MPFTPSTQDSIALETEIFCKSIVNRTAINNAIVGSEIKAKKARAAVKPCIFKAIVPAVIKNTGSKAMVKLLTEEGNFSFSSKVKEG